MAAMMALGTKAQVVMPKETPELEFALQLKVTLGETFGIALFVCAPDFNQDFKGIVLNVWRVK